MIQLQKANVILQAQNNARLEDVQRSNLEILDSARATEQNTAIAAQYARIAAISSRLSLELQAEQLGYQKADFWLK